MVVYSAFESAFDGDGITVLKNARARAVVVPGNGNAEEGVCPQLRPRVPFRVGQPLEGPCIDVSARLQIGAGIDQHVVVIVQIGIGLDTAEGDAAGGE